MRHVFEYMGYSDEEIEKRLAMSKEELSLYYEMLDSQRKKEAEEKNRTFILEFCLKADIAQKLNSGKYTREEVRQHRDLVRSAFARGDNFYDEAFINKYKSMIEFEDVKNKMNNEETYLIDVNRLPSETERVYVAKTQVEFEKIQREISQNGGFNL